MVVTGEGSFQAVVRLWKDSPSQMMLSHWVLAPGLGGYTLDTRHHHSLFETFQFYTSIQETVFVWADTEF